jgi:hypothetical protein
VGKVINSRSLTVKELMRLTPPVILCVNRPDFDKAITDCGYRTISLNLPLTRFLIELGLREIRSTLTDKVKEILPQVEPVYLLDYEILFNPRYEIDALRLFIELARRNKLIIRWSGTTDGDTLIYSELGFDDYKRYRISDYDVVIVK